MAHDIRLHFPDKATLTRNNPRRPEYGTGVTAAGSTSTSTAPPSPSTRRSQPKLNKFKEEDQEEFNAKQKRPTRMFFSSPSSSSSFTSPPPRCAILTSRTHPKKLLHTPPHTPSALSLSFFDTSSLHVTSFEAYDEACEKR